MGIPFCEGDAAAMGRDAAAVREEGRRCDVHLIPSTSVDASQLAAAREDGPLKIWLVSPCSVVLVRLISSTSVNASQLVASLEDCLAPNPTHPAVYSHPALTKQRLETRIFTSFGVDEPRSLSAHCSLKLLSTFLCKNLKVTHMNRGKRSRHAYAIAAALAQAAPAHPPVTQSSRAENTPEGAGQATPA
ncbi:hypothetical protein MRB53_025953 [Persea americana]|uniref:Uncharacterized protein n=1 Tax=Persea americana TaxID=3435 RepID=A0ACC2LGV6_PERAE|nr:hypothetical protein MRB53_025953 [Persea americana]